jgi:hypothetical protein
VVSERLGQANISITLDIYSHPGLREAAAEKFDRIFEKVDILAQVENQSRRRRKMLAELGVHRSNYYRWRQGQPDSVSRRRPWNRVTPEEGDKILAVARDFPGDWAQPAASRLGCYGQRWLPPIINSPRAFFGAGNGYHAGGLQL